MKPALQPRSLGWQRMPRGIGLLDALIGLALLSVGMLALAGFQTKLVAQTTEAQSRAQAMQYANELLNTALVDPANLDCYSFPASGSCANAVARAETDLWGQRVLEQLPGALAAQATRNGTQLTVVIEWTREPAAETRRLQVTTDVQ
jgi:Tfp pilus assembly protein PilV